MYSIDFYKKLKIQKARKETGLFVCEGERAVKQICESNSDSVVEVVCTENFAEIFQKFPVKILNENQFKKFSSSKTPQGIAALVKQPEGIYQSTLPVPACSRVLFLDGVQDPGNVGTLIRSASAFGFDGVVLSDKCADPLSPKVVQSTAGSMLNLWIRKTDKDIFLLELLKKKGFTLVCADMNGDENLAILKNTIPIVVILGQEGSGLSKYVKDISDFSVFIPMDMSKAESLNVAVSGGICMYFCRRKGL